MWTNGRQKEVFKKYTDDHGNIMFMDYNDIPSADGNLDDVNRPSRTSLKNAFDDNLWLIKNHRIIASIDLHADTFQPRNGTQTSVLFLQKKTQAQKDEEEKSSTMADYNIFMAMAEKIGHDKRGNTIFKRDSEGNEILVDDDSSVVTDEDVVKHSKKKKVIDDQTAEIAEIFNKWKISEGIAW